MICLPGASLGTDVLRPVILVVKVTAQPSSASLPFSSSDRVPGMILGAMGPAPSSVTIMRLWRRTLTISATRFMRWIAQGTVLVATAGRCRRAARAESRDFPCVGLFVIWVCLHSLVSVSMRTLISKELHQRGQKHVLYRGPGRLPGILVWLGIILYRHDCKELTSSPNQLPRDSSWSGQTGFLPEAYWPSATSGAFTQRRPYLVALILV